jgi:hypothetical protein
MKIELSMTTRTKNLQHESCAKDALKLLMKGNFKRQTVCDELAKFVQNAFKQN